MKKRESAIMAVITLFAVMAHAQTVYQKDRWGDAVYYFDFEPTMWQIACIILIWCDPSLVETRLPFPPLNHLLQFIPIPRGGTDGVDERDIVTGRLVSPTLEIAVFVHLFHHLVVVFDNQVFG